MTNSLLLTLSLILSPLSWGQDTLSRQGEMFLRPMLEKIGRFSRLGERPEVGDGYCKMEYKENTLSFQVTGNIGHHPPAYFNFKAATLKEQTPEKLIFKGANTGLFMRKNLCHKDAELLHFSQELIVHHQGPFVTLDVNYSCKDQKTSRIETFRAIDSCDFQVGTISVELTGSLPTLKKWPESTNSIALSS